MRRIVFLLMTVLLLSAAACSGATTPTAEPAVADTAAVVENMADNAMDSSVDDAEMTEALADEAMAEDPHDSMETDDMESSMEVMEEDPDHAVSDKSMASGDERMDSETMAELAAWQTIPLTNARTGESFTLGDFAGKTVFVEPMATWCSNCRQQLTNVQQARAQLENDDIVFVALSVETTISNEELAQYADNLGFDWTFAVMSPELLQALADQFGRTITNPPSTPHFIISPDGSVSDLVTGIESVEAIVAQTTN